MRSLEREIAMQNGTPTPSMCKNQGSGFIGTIRAHAEPEEAWAIAMRSISDATGCSDQAVRSFLDSRYGRHFADEVAAVLSSGQELAAAIDHAIERWMDRRIDARIEEEVGIPQGLPYLTGLVCMHEALLELST
jgi:hypothetical protein